MSLPVSILDLAPVRAGSPVSESFADSVALAQEAESHGYRRVWYAEHHNMAAIASSAPAVLIAHIAAHTTSIRLGAGGVMLPNHSPLAIAEQFGTLAELHPGRIDLGLGRAPGGDQNTFRALRRDPSTADSFPRDVQELRGYFSDESIVPGVRATPGAGTEVPLYILGSSMFGAQLAAQLGLPYAFASHFAPDLLQPAVAAYRSGFRPSEQLSEPYVLAAVNAIAAEDPEDAQRQSEASMRTIVRLLVARDPHGTRFSDEEIDLILDSPQGRSVAGMRRYAAIGTADQVGDYLREFAELADADELIVAHQSPTTPQRLASVRLTARAMGLVGVPAGR